MASVQIVLASLAPEQGTYIVQVTCLDENNAPVVPNAGLNWTLTDAKGTVVNSRSGVVLTPASTFNIVLSGEDLAMGGSYFKRARKLLVQGTYDSTLGSNLPFSAEMTFNIANFVGIADNG